MTSLAVQHPGGATFEHAQRVLPRWPIARQSCTELSTCIQVDSVQLLQKGFCIEKVRYAWLCLKPFQLVWYLKEQLKASMFRLYFRIYGAE